MSEITQAVGAPLERQVRPHSGDWMTVREAERLAALWCAGQPLDDLPQWRTAMQVLARELSDTRAALKNANDQAEHFEREWYLRGDEIERLRDEALRFDREPPPDCKCASQCMARGACWRKCSLALGPNASLSRGRRQSARSDS